ncbi:MAG: zinc ribbon domain-containing protein, partial [Terriglobia bacterium]
SAPAIQFKGSGWYVTDYARKPAPAEAGEAKAKADGTGKTEAAKETKQEPAKKSPGPASKKSV